MMMSQLCRKTSTKDSKKNLPSSLVNDEKGDRHFGEATSDALLKPMRLCFTAGVGFEPSISFIEIGSGGVVA